MSSWLLVVGLFSLTIARQGVDGHPLVGAVPDSVLAVAGRNENREMLVTYRENERRRRKTVSGPYWSLEYELPESSTRDAIVEHFRGESARLHGTNHRDAGNRLTFSFFRSDGGETWCQLWATDGNYTLEIVDADSPQHVFFDETSQPSASIVFAPRSVDLDDEARNVLDGIASWLASNPDVRAEVLGARGPLEDPALPGERARTVADALVSRGVASDRLDVESDESSSRFAVTVVALDEEP